MMNLGRLQGFEVCSALITTRLGKVFYLSVIVSTISPIPGCLSSALSVVVSSMLW